MNFVCSEVENMSISINYYEFIKQIYENLTKYIKSYKSETNDYYKKINKLQEKYFPKLSTVKEEFKKMTNIKTNHILSLSSKVPKIINQQILNLKYFVSGIEDTIKSFDKTLKDKNSMSAKYQSEYDDCRNILLKKYKDIEKSKNTYFSSASQTEDVIYKYYLNNSSNPQQTTSSEVITENQVENNIKQTKKYENEYLNLVKSAKSFEEKFFEKSDSSKDNMKRLACEIITKLKDNVVDFLLLLKNCFKLPLSEIDTYLPELIKLDENKKIESIINSTYKKDNNLIPIDVEKYNIKLTQKQTDEGEEEENNYIIEDGVLNTIKKMEESFELIEKNSDEQMNNQIKLRCRDLTFKLLSFSSKLVQDINKDNNIINKEKNEEKENNINNINNEIKEDKTSITEEELKELSQLIEDKSNRAIFLRKINTFRKYGEFEIPEKEFNIICDLFNKIADFIKKENDFSSMNNIIILSETYYKTENDNKIYIQKIIKKNKLFKEKEFWEDYVNSSILKEVQKHVNNDIKDPSIVDSQKVMENEKYEKIIFAQLLPLIKNMIEFELDDEVIKSIVQPLISYYKIKEESANIIYEMIKFKGIKDTEIKKKYYKNLELSVINEKDGEDNEIVTENIYKNTENKNEKKEEEKEEDDDEKINRELIVNVNQTLADEEEEDNDDEDINNKMIKSLDEDEINPQMIKDVDDEEMEDKENNENNTDKEKNENK